MASRSQSNNKLRIFFFLFYFAHLTDSRGNQYHFLFTSQETNIFKDVYSLRHCLKTRVKYFHYYYYGFFFPPSLFFFFFLLILAAVPEFCIKIPTYEWPHWNYVDKHRDKMGILIEIQDLNHKLKSIYSSSGLISLFFIWSYYIFINDNLYILSRWFQTNFVAFLRLASVNLV